MSVITIEIAEANTMWVPKKAPVEAKKKQPKALWVPKGSRCQVEEKKELPEAEKELPEAEKELPEALYTLIEEASAKYEDSWEPDEAETYILSLSKGDEVSGHISVFDFPRKDGGKLYCFCDKEETRRQLFLMKIAKKKKSSCQK